MPLQFIIAAALTWCAALLSLACAFVAAQAAVRNSRLSSAFVDFRLHLTALETAQEKILEQQKRLAVRLNLAEGKAQAIASGRRAPSNGEIDWRDDPSGFIAKHTRPLVTRSSE